MPAGAGADLALVSTSVPPPGYLGGPVGQPQPAQQLPVSERPLPPTPPRGRSRSAPKLLAAAVVVAAMGGAAFLFLGSGRDALSGPIAQAAMVSSTAPGYRLHMSIEMSSSSLPGPITGSGTAVVDTRDHVTSMSLDMNFGAIPQVAQELGSPILQMQSVIDGSAVYAKLPSQLISALPTDGRQWLGVNLAKLGGIPGLSEIGNDPTTQDPSSVLQYLSSQSTTVANEGRAKVDGVETTHYHAELSIAHLADNLPSPLRGDAQRDLSEMEQGSPTGEIPVDVWIDSAHLVRRATLSLDLAIPNGPILDESVTVDIGHYGPQAPPATPPASDVFDLNALLAASR
jgi:hypothetical protein